jgi:hypothetical protein
MLHFLVCNTFYQSERIYLYTYHRSGSISRGFRGEFRQWQIIPGICEASPVMANQFSVKLCPKPYLLFAMCFLFSRHICALSSFEILVSCNLPIVINHGFMGEFDAI